MSDLSGTGSSDIADAAGLLTELRVLSESSAPFSNSVTYRLRMWSNFSSATVAVVCQGLIWSIPGWNPNPYALGECLVGQYNRRARAGAGDHWRYLHRRARCPGCGPAAHGAFWLSRRQPLAMKH